MSQVEPVTAANGLYSGDDHMDLAYVPADLWQSRVAAKWREQAPKIQKNKDGKTIWCREGRPWGTAGSKKQDGRKVVFDDLGMTEEMEPGVFRPSTAKYRLEDMDRDRVYAQVLYNFLDWGFEDPILKEACIQAFNDWISEFSSANRERLIGLAVLPTHDPQAAIKELERTARLGLRGAMFEFTGAAVPVHDRAWDPLWSIAEETDTAISFHIMRAKGQAIFDDEKWMRPARATIGCMQLAGVLSELMWSGVAVRHPKIKLVLAESSLGWIPFVLERFDFEQKNYSFLGDAIPRQSLREIFRRNFYCTFQEEKLGVQLIPHVGEDNVMWASDYPHADGSFPRSVQAVDHIFEGIDPVVKRKVTRDNTKKLYHIS